MYEFPKKKVVVTHSNAKPYPGKVKKCKHLLTKHEGNTLKLFLVCIKYTSEEYPLDQKVPGKIVCLTFFLRSKLLLELGNINK